MAFLQGQKGLSSSNLWWYIKPKKWQLPEFGSNHKQASPWPLLLKQTLRILRIAESLEKVNFCDNYQGAIYKTVSYDLHLGAWTTTAWKNEVGFHVIEPLSQTFSCIKINAATQRHQDISTFFLVLSSKLSSSIVPRKFSSEFMMTIKVEN